MLAVSAASNRTSCRARMVMIRGPRAILVRQAWEESDSARPAPSPRPHLHDRGGFYVRLVKNPPRSWRISTYEQDQTHIVRKHRHGLLFAALTTAAASEWAAAAALPGAAVLHGPRDVSGPARGRAHQNSRCSNAGERQCSPGSRPPEPPRGSQRPAGGRTAVGLPTRDTRVGLMEERVLERTGRKVSVIGLGAWQLG